MLRHDDVPEGIADRFQNLRSGRTTQLSSRGGWVSYEPGKAFVPPRSAAAPGSARLCGQPTTPIKHRTRSAPDHSSGRNANGANRCGSNLSARPEIRMRSSCSLISSTVAITHSQRSTSGDGEYFDNTLNQHLTTIEPSSSISERRNSGKFCDSARSAPGSKTAGHNKWGTMTSYPVGSWGRTFSLTDAAAKGTGVPPIVNDGVCIAP